MSFDTKLTEDYMGIIHVGSGIVTGQEILEACRVVTALVQTTENFHYKLVDFSGANDLQITPEELQEIVEEDRLIAAARPNATIVIVVPDEKMRAIAKHWQNLVVTLGWNTHIVESRAEALDWLLANAGVAVET